MNIQKPSLNPKITKPLIEGLKSFANTVIQTIIGLWADSTATWADSVYNWGSLDTQYPSNRPTFGKININKPTVK